MSRVFFIFILFHQFILAKVPTGFNGCLSDRYKSEKHCRPMKENFQNILETYARDKDSVESFVKKELEKIKGPKSYNYYPILLAAIFDLKDLKKELKDIQEIEKKFNIKNEFASTLLRKFENKKCSDLSIHFEICQFEDSRVKKMKRYYK